MGPAHKVDLKHYDLLILVEIYKVSASVLSPCSVSSNYASIEHAFRTVILFADRQT